MPGDPAEGGGFRLPIGNQNIIGKEKKKSFFSIKGMQNIGFVEQSCAVNGKFPGIYKLGKVGINRGYSHHWSCEWKWSKWSMENTEQAITQL